MSSSWSAELPRILAHYASAFGRKVIPEQPRSSDVLMDIFSITPARMAAAPQYWSRELGMCWERLVRELFTKHVAGSTGPLQLAGGSPCDLVAQGMAIDTKYRLGSGDAGTLRKLAGNAAILRELGLEPVMLFLRTDSLAAATSRMRGAGWRMLEGQASFDFIWEHTGQDLMGFLQSKHVSATSGREGMRDVTWNLSFVPSGAAWSVGQVEL